MQNLSHNVEPQNKTACTSVVSHFLGEILKLEATERLQSCSMPSTCFCGIHIQCAVKREMTGSLHLAGLHNLAAYDFSHIAVQVDFRVFCVHFSSDILYIFIIMK